MVLYNVISEYSTINKAGKFVRRSRVDDFFADSAESAMRQAAELLAAFRWRSLVVVEAVPAFSEPIENFLP